MHRALIVVAFALGVMAVACAEPLPVGRSGDDPGPTGPPSSGDRYQASATVLEAPGRPPMLCLGGIAESLPPQCGTLPIPNWDWDAVQGEERVSGTTWGEYHVVGTFDGSSFTVLDVGAPRRPPPSHDPIRSPCPKPAEGWVASDLARTSDADLQAAGSLAFGQRDSAGWWIKVIGESRTEGHYGPDEIVLNAAFTRDIERHRAELAEVWGGPLCVVRYEHTEAELQRIQRELTDRGSTDFGLEVLFSSPDVVNNRVEVGVILFDEATEAAVDDRYGEGTVRLVAALEPA